MSVEQKINNGAYNTQIPYSKETRRERALDEGRLRTVFKSDLEEQYGLVGHPKADLLFNMALDRGGDLIDIYFHYDTLSELITP